MRRVNLLFRSVVLMGVLSLGLNVQLVFGGAMRISVTSAPTSNSVSVVQKHEFRKNQKVLTTSSLALTKYSKTNQVSSQAVKNLLTEQENQNNVKGIWKWLKSLFLPRGGSVLPLLSLIFGCVGLIMVILLGTSFGIGTAGLILGIISLAKGHEPKVFAIIGTIAGGLAILLSWIWIIILGAAIIALL